MKIHKQKLAEACIDGLMEHGVIPGENRENAIKAFILQFKCTEDEAREFLELREDKKLWSLLMSAFARSVASMQIEKEKS